MESAREEARSLRSEIVAGFLMDGEGFCGWRRGEGARDGGGVVFFLEVENLVTLKSYGLGGDERGRGETTRLEVDFAPALFFISSLSRWWI